MTHDFDIYIYIYISIRRKMPLKLMIEILIRRKIRSYDDDDIIIYKIYDSDYDDKI